MIVSTEELRKRLLKYYELRLTSRKHIKISDPVRITSGWETDVFSFNTEYQIDGKLGFDELILRLYPGNGAKTKASKEFYVMTQLHEIGCPVPQVYLLELDESILSRPFVVMQRINGRLMGETLNKSENTMTNTLQLFCKMFVDLHALDVTPFLSNSRIVSDPSLYQIKDPYNSVNRILSDFRHRMALISADKPAFNLFKRIADWLEESKSTVPSRRLSLAHLDYHPNNIIVRNDGAPFIIDWTNFDITDYRTDLAWTLLLCSTYDEPKMRDCILRMYEKIAKSNAENIEYFEVIAATRRIGSIYLSLKYGAEKQGMLPETVETMRRQARHVEAVIKVLSDRTGISFREFEKLKMV
jgi:aminoglycoside phosphotransferase (APT) family kinase protein